MENLFVSLAVKVQLTVTLQSSLSQSKLLLVCDRHSLRIQVFQNEHFQYCFGQCGTQPGTFYI